MENINEDNQFSVRRCHKTILFLRYFKNQSSFFVHPTNIWGGDCDSKFTLDILHDYAYKSIDWVGETLSFTTDVLSFSMHKYSCNDIIKAINIFKPKVLIHCSDEWDLTKWTHKIFSKEEQIRFYTDVFPKVNLVYKEYVHPYLLDKANNVKYKPIGIHSWDIGDIKHITNILSIQNRQLKWCFIGSPKKGRDQILQELKTLKPYFFGTTNKGDNPEIYKNAIFTICPKGNFHIECHRQYAVSAYGSIPILICTQKIYDDAYSSFDLIPPWMRADTIKDAKLLIEKHIDDIEFLNKKQKEILNWLRDLKILIKKNIDEACAKK